MTSHQREHKSSDEPKVGDGGGDHDDTSKKRCITNEIPSFNSTRHDLHLLEFKSGNQKNGDEDKAEVEIQLTQVDGNETGRSSKSPTTSLELGVDASPQQHGQLWGKDQSGTWWKQCISPDYPEEKFRSHFRMGWGTFDMICDALASSIAKKDTPIRPAIPVRQRVVVCVWRLASGEPLHVVSQRFGVAISTCQKIFHEVCAAIWHILMPRFIQWPNQTVALKDNFKAISGIPDVVGAIYTTHVQIIQPIFWASDYIGWGRGNYNKNPNYLSTTIQGVVNPFGTFTDVCIGCPGALRDDEILCISGLQQRGRPQVMPSSRVVGGPSYPLMEWLLVPYPHQNLSREQHSFNKKVMKVHHVAVDAFARFRGRWAFLQKRIDVNISHVSIVIGACCVLHNICEIKGEVMSPELRCDVIDFETVPENLVHSESAIKARDKIAHTVF